jgi:hypothetical protein
MVESSKTFCEKASSGNGSTFSIIVQYLQRLKKSIGKRNKRWTNHIHFLKMDEESSIYADVIILKRLKLKNVMFLLITNSGRN